MSVPKFALAILTLSALAGRGLASPPTYGAWKGQVRLNMDKIPGAKDPKNRAKFAHQRSLVEKMAISLTLQADHTFAMKVSGGLSAAQNRSTKGKWTLRGDQLTLVADTSNVKPIPFKVATNGKSFSMAIMGGEARMTFFR